MNYIKMLLAIITMAATMVMAVNTSTPGVLDVAYSAALIGNPPKTSWHIAGSEASRKDGKCYYAGQVVLPMVNGKCYSVVLSHLTNVFGINADQSNDGTEYVKNWKYFHCTYDTYTEVIMNRECPDVFVSRSTVGGKVLQEVFYKEENQARYYAPDTPIPDITMAIPLDGFGKFRKYEKQVLYRDLYDWEHQCSPSDCGTGNQLEYHTYDDKAIQNTMKTYYIP